MKAASLLLLLLALPLRAATVTLEWDDAQPDVTWSLEQKDGDGEWRAIQSVSVREATVGDLAPGSYSWRVRAMKLVPDQKPPAVIYSDYSDSVTAIVPSAPAGMRLRIAIEASTDLKDWRTVALASVPELGPRTFYRLAFQPSPPAP